MGQADDGGEQNTGVEALLNTDLLTANQQIETGGVDGEEEGAFFPEGEVDIILLTEDESNAVGLAGVMNADQEQVGFDIPGSQQGGPDEAGDGQAEEEDRREEGDGEVAADVFLVPIRLKVGGGVVRVVDDNRS